MYNQAEPLYVVDVQSELVLLYEAEGHLFMDVPHGTARHHSILQED
jgi:hypothetical protein